MRSKWMIAVAVLVTLTGCKAGKPKSVFVDPALETVVPPDTTFAAGADLDAIRTTHVFQKYVGTMKIQQLDDFAQKTGIDPRKDLWQVLSCSNGKSGLFLARGKFSEREEEPNVKLPGTERMNYKGYSLFGDQQSAVMFLNTSTAVAGRTADLRTTVDLRNQGSHGLPPALKRRVEGISHDNQVWAVFSGGLANLSLGVAPESNIGQVLDAFRGIEGGTIALNLRNGLEFAAHLDCKTPADAKRTRDAIKGIVGLARLNTPENRPDLLQLYDAVDVNNTASQVDVKAKVGPELEDKFVDLWLAGRRPH